MAAFFNFSVDTGDVHNVLTRLRKDQVPFATSLAVNTLAKDIIRIEKIEMQSAFDRPTSFIVRRSLRLDPSKKSTKPFALILAQDVFGRHGEAVQRTLEPHIEGGNRYDKAAEYRLKKIGAIDNNEWLIGAKSAQNRYGNVPSSESIRMLSFFKAFWESGFSANRAAGSTGGYRYFVQKLPRGKGIFRVKHEYTTSRKNPGKQILKRGKPKLIWYVASGKPKYKKRFDFYGEAERHAAKYAAYFAEQAMKKALLTAR